MRATSANVLRVWERASDAERDQGDRWYWAAHAFCVDLADRYGLTVDAACALVAVLSPRTSWDQNMVLADQFARTGDAPTLGDHKAKARRILAGEQPADVLRGHKVCAFWQCLVDPDTADAVCVDRHAFDVAHGRRTDDQARKALERVGAYERVAACYRRAAARVGVSPAVMQATTWLVWRSA